MWTPGNVILVVCTCGPVVGAILVAAILAAKGKASEAQAVLQQINAIQNRLNSHGEQITQLAHDQIPPAVQAALVQQVVTPTITGVAATLKPSFTPQTSTQGQAPHA